jgi:hypothetical protein
MAVIMGMMRLSTTMVMSVVAVLFVFHPVRIPSMDRNHHGAGTANHNGGHQTKPV